MDGDGRGVGVTETEEEMFTFLSESGFLSDNFLSILLSVSVDEV